jgi:hypothetical protein
MLLALRLGLWLLLCHRPVVATVLRALAPWLCALFAFARWPPVVGAPPSGCELFTSAEEHAVVTFLKNTSALGFPLNREALGDLFRKASEGRINPITQQPYVCGAGFVDSFL